MILIGLLIITSGTNSYINLDVGLQYENLQSLGLLLHFSNIYPIALGVCSIIFRCSLYIFLTV